LVLYPIRYPILYSFTNGVSLGKTMVGIVAVLCGDTAFRVGEGKTETTASGKDVSVGVGTKVEGVFRLLFAKIPIMMITTTNPIIQKAT